MSVSFEIRPTFISKLTTATQLATILFVLAHQCLAGIFSNFWVERFYWLTAGLTVISGFNYMMRGLTFINHDT